MIEAIRHTVSSEFEVLHEPARAGEIKHTYCDITKAAKAFGFNPRVSVRSGLEKTWEWFRSESP